MAMIELHNVDKWFDDFHVLKNINKQVENCNQPQT
jgi:ABC-type polar amino acid transport system ATPase subunit